MHFGLTGSLNYQKDYARPVKFSKVIFIFSDHSALHWINKRKFGSVWLVDNLYDVTGIKKLDPDALSITQKEYESLYNLI